MRILICSRYDRLGASSRLRLLQYVPALEQAGFEVEIQALFDNSYVQGLQQNRRQWLAILVAYWRRFWAMIRRVKRADVVIIEKELFPWLPYVVERLVLTTNTPYVLDYDDAVYHYYDTHKNTVVRALLSQKHRRLMCRASGICAGNSYIAAYAKATGNSAVSILPTVVDLARYPAHAQAKDDDKTPVIGWIGQQSTAYLLAQVLPVIKEFVAAGRARFRVIGLDDANMEPPIETQAWSEATEVASLHALDIGIMPLVDAPFERGKCGYKLIQYMACGLPVIASPVGVNKELVEHGRNGYLAQTPVQWRQALTNLLNDKSLRQAMGAIGRDKVEQHYSLEVAVPQLVHIFNSAVDHRGQS